MHARHDQTIEMNGDILALLEPRYSRTLETSMTVTEPLALREAQLPHLQGARHFTLYLALAQNAFP